MHSLRLLAADHALNRKIWMRMPLIHGINDTDDIIRRTCDFYEENHLTYVTLLPYHELGISKYKSLGAPFENFTPPDAERLHAIRDLFCSRGIRTEILGEDIQ